MLLKDNHTPYMWFLPGDESLCSASIVTMASLVFNDVLHANVESEQQQQCSMRVCGWYTGGNAWHVLSECCTQ